MHIVNSFLKDGKKRGNKNLQNRTVFDSLYVPKTMEKS
jgi:hypothetical protein